ncbi:MAG: hypothetical protein E5Y59_19875 [Mesorhizobium sp.]|nr:MAG: hypothetical protein E5Y59_19875 [Mesorhizobium sp.]
MERKLAAIMAADIVGYSLLMAENEASTYASTASGARALRGRHGGSCLRCCAAPPPAGLMSRPP